MTDQGSSAPHTPFEADFSGQKVIVTGATGFIGRRLVAALQKTNADVTALVRSARSANALRSAGIGAEICKLEPGAALDRAVAGQDIVFHFAYDVRASGADNLAAFDALLEASKKAGVSRFIHASSIVVYDDWPAGLFDEASAASSAGGGDYRQAKIAMEQRLLDGDLPAAILRPTIVYGPGSSLWVDALRAQLRQGPVVLPDPVGTCPAVYVKDVVNGALAAAIVPELGQERFILTGPDQPTWQHYFEALAAQIGEGSVELRPKAELIAQIGTVSDQVDTSGPSLAAQVSAQLRQLIGHERFETIVSAIKSHVQPIGPVLPNPYMLNLYGATPHLSCEKTHARLGVRPVYDLQAGMAAIAQVEGRG